MLYRHLDAYTDERMGGGSFNSFMNDESSGNILREEESQEELGRAEQDEFQTMQAEMESTGNNRVCSERCRKT